jgi:AraC-like DNA-binding protein
MRLSEGELQRLCRAKELLRAEESALPDVARELGMSPFRLLRQFKAVFGLTPHEFRTAARMERAKALLRSGDRTVTEVCFEVGFSSVGSFSALFTRHVGVSPSRFRQVSCERGPAPHCLALMYAPVQFSRSAR